MARPTKLNEERHKRLCDLVRAGNWLESAAAMAGVSSAVVRDWCRRGEREAEKGMDTIYTRFAADFELARAASEGHLVMRIVQAASKDWKAAAWLLSRKNPGRFGDKVTNRNENVTVPATDEVASALASSEALRRAAEERARVEALEREAGER